jgi:uncharacterized protein (TIGR02246 family)
MVRKEVISLERGNKADMLAIKEKLRQYAVTINDGDFEGWISLWTDDGIQMPPDTPTRIGKEQIRKGMKPAFDQFILKMAITNKETTVSGDFGFARGTFTETLIPKAGGEAEKYEGKYLSIFEKQTDGFWKIARDCFNFDGPS